MAMSYFTPEALQKFQEMCAAGMDFGEGPAYDFAMCLMANGDVYGVELPSFVEVDWDATFDNMDEVFCNGYVFNSQF